MQSLSACTPAGRPERYGREEHMAACTREFVQGPSLQPQVTGFGFCSCSPPMGIGQALFHVVTEQLALERENPVHAGIRVLFAALPL